MHDAGEHLQMEKVLEVCACLVPCRLWSVIMVEERWFQLHQADLLRNRRPLWSWLATERISIATSGFMN